MSEAKVDQTSRLKAELTETIGLASVKQTFVDGFHRHLDDCKQCRERPFDLCKIGRILLRCARAIEDWKLDFDTGVSPTQAAKNFLGGIRSDAGRAFTE